NPRYAIISEENIIQNTLSGNVKDENGEPLIGVNVSVKGTTKGTSTNQAGAFTLEANPGDVLVISYIGFISQEIIYTNQSSIEVILKADNTSIEEVVVIGYGTQKRSEITGSISTIKGEDISKITSGGF